MTRDDGNFLSRWSKRKVEARKGEKGPEDAPTLVPNPASSAAAVTSAPAGTQPEAKAVLELPSVDSLTLDSDFTPFLQPGVDPALKREALKKLVRDPRFNVMDGLDVYIDDYSKPDPLPEEWLGKLNQLKRLGHYLEPSAEGAEASESEPSKSQKAMEEQPVEQEIAPDTQSKDSPSLE